MSLRYDPIGSTFKEGDVFLMVQEGVQDGSSCAKCFYNYHKENGGRLFSGSCYSHGHACTPLNRKDKKHVVFRKIQLV